MTYQIAIESALNSGVAVTMNAKGKSGSFARAIAFASRDVRMAHGRALYAKWLANAQFRPIVADILDTLVPAAAKPYVEAMVPVNGPVPKAQFEAFCVAVDAAVQRKMEEARAKGKTGELKGEKAFVYGIVQRVAGAVKGETIEMEATEMEPAALRRVA
jgi:hypothetical protein